MGFIHFTESLDEKIIRETARKSLSYICLIFDRKVHLVLSAMQVFSIYYNLEPESPALLSKKYEARSESIQLTTYVLGTGYFSEGLYR